MSSAEILTRVTIWIAILAYVAGAAAFALGKKDRRDAAARAFWTAAGVSLFAHVVCAFHFYHQWNHGAAIRDTARQTREVFGLNWGGGLYINYVLLIGWVVDLVWWWVGGLDSYRRRPWALVAAWHGFVFFMIFNATVVFGSGGARWAGLFACLALCLVCLRFCTKGPMGL